VHTVQLWSAKEDGEEAGVMLQERIGKGRERGRRRGETERGGG